MYFLSKGGKYPGYRKLAPRPKVQAHHRWQGQILPGVGVGVREWGAGEGEPEVVQAAWKSWQI